jgi:hypothetical protein
VKKSIITDFFNIRNSSPLLPPALVSERRERTSLVSAALVDFGAPFAYIVLGALATNLVGGKDMATKKKSPKRLKKSKKLESTKPLTVVKSGMPVEA